MTLRDEVTALLQALLRLDTVNPPGNETLAAEVLRDYLARNGVECELFAREPHRANLVARIRGGDGPSLAFLSHTDTVLADPAEWERDPWSGDLVDGEVWGRGALDMKDQVAASTVAFASLAREGFALAGDLVLVVVADEEVGAGYGPQLARRGASGRGPVRLRDQRRRRRTARSRQHPRLPLCDGREDVGAVQGASARTKRPCLDAGHRRQRAREGGALPGGARRLRAAARADPGGEGLARGDARRGSAARGGARTRPRSSTRCSPRPRRAPARVHALADDDRRVAPAERRPGAVRDHGRLPAAARDDAGGRRAADPGGARATASYELEFLEAVGGTRSQADTPLWDALARFTEELEPGARLAPMACPGFTDSHYLRTAYGTTAYGYFPLKTMDTELATKLVHSANERIAVDDLELGVDMLRSVASDAARVMSERRGRTRHLRHHRRPRAAQHAPALYDLTQQGCSRVR